MVVSSSVSLASSARVTSRACKAASKAALVGAKTVQAVLVSFRGPVRLAAVAAAMRVEKVDGADCAAAKMVVGVVALVAWSTVRPSATHATANKDISEC